MEHVAIDLGGRESQICIRREDGSILEEHRYPTAALEEFLRKRPRSRVIVETSAEAFRVADGALACGHEVRGRPGHTCASAGSGRTRHQERSEGCPSPERDLLSYRLAIGSHSVGDGAPTQVLLRQPRESHRRQDEAGEQRARVASDEPLARSPWLSAHIPRTRASACEGTQGGAAEPHRANARGARADEPSSYRSGSRARENGVRGSGLPSIDDGTRSRTRDCRAVHRRARFMCTFRRRPRSPVVPGTDSRRTLELGTTATNCNNQGRLQSCPMGARPGRLGRDTQPPHRSDGALGSARRRATRPQASRRRASAKDRRHPVRDLARWIDLSAVPRRNVGARDRVVLFPSLARPLSPRDDCPEAATAIFRVRQPEAGLTALARMRRRQRTSTNAPTSADSRMRQLATHFETGRILADCVCDGDVCAGRGQPLHSRRKLTLSSPPCASFVDGHAISSRRLAITGERPPSRAT
jgi:hypothetical protein